MYGNFDPANATHWSSNEAFIAFERDLLIERYVATTGQQIRQQTASNLREPTSQGIDRPNMSPGQAVPPATGPGRRSRALSQDMDAVQIEGASLRDEVGRHQRGGRAFIEGERDHRRAEAPSSDDVTREAARAARAKHVRPDR